MALALLLSKLERSTQAAGGFVLSRVVGTPTSNGQTIVEDGDPITFGTTIVWRY